MKEYIKDRVVEVATYILETNSTVRDTAKKYGISKSTVQIANLATMLFYGVGDSIQSPISYNFGANKLDRVNELKKIALITSLAIGAIICIILFLKGNMLASFFIQDTEIIKLSSYIMLFLGISFLFSGTNMVMTTYYTSINQPLLSAIIAFLRSLVGIFIGIIVLPVFFEENGVWGAIVFTEIFTLIITLYVMNKFPFGKDVMIK